MPDSFLFFFQAEDGIRDLIVTGVQTCALPISLLEKHVFQTGSELASKLLDKENIWNKIFTVFGGIAEITDSKETSVSNKINALD